MSRRASKEASETSRDTPLHKRSYGLLDPIRGRVIKSKVEEGTIDTLSEVKQPCVEDKLQLLRRKCIVRLGRVDYRQCAWEVLKPTQFLKSVGLLRARDHSVTYH